MENSISLKVLLQKYIDNRCSEAEFKQLMQYLEDVNSEEELQEFVQRYYQSEQETYRPTQNQLSEGLEKIKLRIRGHELQPPETKVVKFWTLKLLRYSAAAILIFATAITFFLLQTKKQDQKFAVKTVGLQHDIAPGHDNAILTLADGSTIVLDSAANGTLARQNGVSVLKMNGQIAYKSNNEVKEKEVYNQISTAKGNQYKLVLADGSIVWLNAASSIRFPTNFIGNERRVEITGEAYFEVAKDASRPFKVLVHSGKGNSEVEVLGTHFNVNAYDDEPDIKTTLLEGAVKIKTGENVLRLFPGQQAICSSKEIIINKSVETEDVIAWKNGYFVFDNTNIKALMRQVSRWYDVEVKFDETIEDEGYSGRISKSMPLSKFLKLLELNDIHAKVEGRTINIIQ